MWLTGLWLFLLHAAMLTFDMKLVAMLDAFVFMAMVAAKLFVYSRFMDSQHDKYRNCS
jgi:hypothetical protein